jgi:hypothetical protein
LDSKRPDGDSVKETSPFSKFLAICTTIQGRDLFTIPLNKTVGAPTFTKPLAFKPLPIYVFFLHHQHTSKTNGGQWQQASRR